jgi:thioredoxin-related protein
MKRFFIAFVAGCLLALATSNGANAQNSNNIVSAEQFKTPLKINRSVFPEETNSSILDESKVSVKALKDFKKSYKNPDDAKWTKNTYGVTAHFNSNGIDNVIYYNKKGNWEASLKGYFEDKLDRNVRRIVKQKYYDDKITYVQEIETDATIGKPTYMVHLESDSDFKIVRICDGEMDVYEAFAKQK